MKFSEQWLREWVNPKVNTAQLAEQLTMAGLEVGAILPVTENDQVIDIDLTPNRCDCLNIAGIARDVSAINRCACKPPLIKDISAQITDTFPIYVTAKSACPRYVGRIIRGINCKAETPLWMQEKLRRSDISVITSVVDVTNYVMLELGQPLHAFDLAKLHGNIQVRFSKAKEAITLLDGQQLLLDKQALVIADNQKALALAGIMGGIDSGVSEATSDIFLESAFFDPLTIASCTQHYGINTDSSHRFERGVDFNLQIKAIQRVTKLLLDVVGGKAGPINEVVSKKYLPKSAVIRLRRARIERVLGISITDKEVRAILQLLGMRLENVKDGWLVAVPSHRFDIELEIDLLEELVRIYGYNHLPCNKPSAELAIVPSSEAKLSIKRIHALLMDRGYHEAITYSFVDSGLYELLCPQDKPLSLKNPISSDLSIMRSSLWPGLIKAVLYNQHRQQTRIRLFETGLCFIKQKRKLQQILLLGGVITGNAYPEQWNMVKREVDFFDVKGDVQALLKLTGFNEKNISFVRKAYPALHPNRCARIYHNNKEIGYLGELHPRVKQQLGINTAIYLFELDLSYIQNALIPKFVPISKFPIIRRDIAIIVDEGVSVQQLKEKMFAVNNTLLRNVQIFDIYYGENIKKGKKSVALNLIFQHPSRTLIDEEIDGLVEQIVKKLKEQFNIILRG